MPETSLNPAIGRLAVESLGAYPAFLERLAEDTELPTGFLRSGVLRLAYGGDAAGYLQARLDDYAAAGLAAEWLTSERCVERAPGLSAEGLSGGLLCADEAQVHGGWLLAALEEAATERGARVRVERIAAVDGKAEPVRLGLQTGQSLSCDRLVWALGSWSGKVPGLTLPVHPVKGQLLVFPQAAGPGPILFHGSRYLLSKADGSVILGATMEEDAGFSLEKTAAVEELRDELERLWPDLAGRPA
jgi:glycine/D-amino acid oxidase-like deaminating enzyme